MTDHDFRELALLAAEEHARGLLGTPPAGAHRELMRDAKVLLSVAVAGGADAGTRDRLVAAAAERVEALHALQSPLGLFVGGDNVQSPPDSAFTVNDACDAYVLTAPATEGIAEAGVEAANGVGAVRARLAEVVLAAAEPLLRGGVHTPNHRWELSAALARIHRSFPDERLLARIEEWLSEGVDIDECGLYSERSPNYAAHVSNPSLTLLARVLGRPELYEIVLRNLRATLALVRPDDSVETVQSRRQDQRARFPLHGYLLAYRLAAVVTGEGAFAATARRAARTGARDPELLAELLLDPRLGEALPDAVERPLDGITHLPTIALAGRRSGPVESVVYGGSDYASYGRIRSGLANEPVFLRLFGASAVLDSVRLSRSFFDVGPFRADGLQRTGEASFRLHETVRAVYYQPLPPSRRNAEGRYELADDGRFSAAMSFATRPRDVVTMRTVVDAELREDGVGLAIELDAPVLSWSLEFAFRAGGVVEGGVLVEGDVWALPSGVGAYRVGDERIVVEMEGAEPSARPLPYQPGQDYAFLGGTDAAGGVRVLVGGSAPARFTVRLRVERAGRA